MIFLGTIRGPGADAAVIRLPDRDVAVALSTDGCGRYCYLDPYEGARLAVAEAARNVACVGARPLAVTNCLNFGNPEKPDVMWQFAEVVRGMADACRELSTPVTGGNVSFYNETGGRAIFPTPVVGMLGVIQDPSRATSLGFATEGDAIVFVGETNLGDLGGSEYAKAVNGVVAGRPPSLDFVKERALHEFLQEVSGTVRSAHDLSKGGFAVALVEAAVAGGLGATITLPEGEAHRVLFSETASRALVSCDPRVLEDVLAGARRKGLSAASIGSVGGDALELDVCSIDLETAKRAYQDALATALSATMGTDGRRS
jgi:phosphoribosylformylglycinamidine synthase